MTSSNKKLLDLSTYDRWPLFLLFILMLYPIDLYIFISKIFDSLALLTALIVAVFYDVKYIKQAGFKAPYKFLILLLPVYLWIRDTNTKKQNRNLFWLGVLFFCSGIFINYTISRHQAVEEDVCAVLNTFDELKNNQITCIKAYRMKKQYEGYWIGYAHLSNDTNVNVSADYNKEEGMVYVTLY